MPYEESTAYLYLCRLIVAAGSTRGSVVRRVHYLARRRRVRWPGLTTANEVGTDQRRHKAQGDHDEERDHLGQRAPLEHDLMLHHGAHGVSRSRSISPGSSGMRPTSTSERPRVD